MMRANSAGVALQHSRRSPQRTSHAVRVGIDDELATRDRVRTRRVDWRTDRLDEKFDLIIGADVLYERAQWDFLEPFWRAHLSPGGRIVLGEPGRQTGEMFPDWVSARGWAIEIEPIRLEERSKTIRVFVLRNSAGGKTCGDR